MKDFYKEIVEVIKKEGIHRDNISKLKLRLARKYRLKKVPTNIDILMHANEKDVSLLKQLQTKPIRTMSGVSVIAIMTKPFKCPHGTCTMCPGGPGSEFGDVPQSYTGKAPATLRAIRNSFDPYLQVFNRLEQYVVIGHNFDKVELIIMGGTFPSLPDDYKESFAHFSFKAMNDFSRLFFKNKKFDLKKFKKFFELPQDVKNDERYKRVTKKMLKLKNSNITSLEDEQLFNENSNVRCIGLTIETSPTNSSKIHADEMLRFGCTRIELGVQNTSNKSLKLMNRGHTVEDTIEAIAILKDLGFKLNFHVMPGALGSNKAQDVKMLKRIVEDSDFCPDMLKIYPCMVMKGTVLYDIWKRGDYTPLSTLDASKMISEFKKIVPKYVRIMRVQRDTPTHMTEAGVDITNLRQLVHKELKKDGSICNCIRCREPMGKSIDKTTLSVFEYNSSGGKDFFISVEDVEKNLIAGFTRLRFPSRYLRKEIVKDSALLRELHVYGSAVNIGEKGNVQHRGIGKSLLREAEKICVKNNKKKLIIISGVGVREYYKKLGYSKEGPYMVKNL